MNVLIFGIQGSGKSTVGKYIAEKMNVPYVATGDIFRELKDEDSPLGKMVKERIDQGLLVPDEPTMEMVNQKLEAFDAKSGFVLDGAPRNLNQVRMFEKNVDLIVLVELNKEKAIERLLKRSRHDDTRESIEKRLSWYSEQTKPVIDYYKNKNARIIKVDNTPSEDVVRKNVDDLFKEFKRD